MRDVEPPAARRLSWLLILGALALLSVAILVGTTPDEEEYRISILTTLLHARALASGTFPFWTSELGLGQPHPLGQNFIAHPLMPLLLVMRPDSWARLLQMTQLGLLIVGSVMLGRRLRLSSMATALMTVTWMLAAPVQNYVLTDFWPSALFGWSLMPGLLAALMTLLDCDGRAKCLQTSLAAGLLAGLTLINGHPGYTAVWVIPMLVFLAVHWRRLVEDWAWWTLAAVVTVAIASPMLLHVGEETRRFPAGLARPNYGTPLRWPDMLDLFVRPLNLDMHGFFDVLRARGTRTPFFGPPFAWLALAAVFVPGRHRRLDVMAALIVSVVLAAMPGLAAFKIFPATYLFRDPLILFGTISAAAVLDQLRRAGRSGLVLAISTTQVIALTVAAWPFVSLTLAAKPWPRTVAAFAEEGPLVQQLVSLTSTGSPGRLDLTPTVVGRMDHGALIADGIWRNAFAYHGLRVINGTFKGISTDSVWPSAALPYGTIGSPDALQHASATLNLLGIRYLLATQDDDVATSLVMRAILTAHTGERLVLYENPKAVGAFLIEPAATGVALSLLPGCTDDVLLCRDFTSVAARQLSGSVRVDGRDGTLHLRATPAAEPRTAVIAEMYRPEWRAGSARGRAVVREAFGGLIAVDVPPGVTDIDLHYRPVGRMMLTVLSALTVIAATLGIVLSRVTGV